MSFIRRLEPEIKFFRFEKTDEDYYNLSEEEKREEAMNIKNGVHFAKKVLLTGECDVLILDEFLGVLQNSMVATEEVDSLIRSKSDETEIIMTGRVMDERILQYADEIYKIKVEKA